MAVHRSYSVLITVNRIDQLDGLALEIDHDRLKRDVYDEHHQLGIATEPRRRNPAPISRQSAPVARAVQDLW